MSKYTKADIIECMADDLNMSKKDAKKAVDYVFNFVDDVMVEGGVLTIQGHGQYCVRDAKPRTFKQIHTQELVSVGARILPKLKFSKALIKKLSK